ncbi:uncharacterized protein BO72DRAFT_451305 [Aspergillus fijiensis CBS 313.89]|uniref:Uncharacterized protein n=1 Tax=Aspergillus fijiensis CBS 313.89 TaxID=1448319 RepID=A0A8G1RI49_9EURO|nr:uncharacterized protein BO72DRAFT_451305 [Aspergillus fijiensis CBS 313.89]RAK73775.1 hypothetical protein BO72DRAFT_451305 [Aspergillus fijiensis CBS 313.89]
MKPRCVASYTPLSLLSHCRVQALSLRNGALINQDPCLRWQVWLLQCAKRQYDSDDKTVKHIMDESSAKDTGSDVACSSLIEQVADTNWERCLC